MSHLYHLCRLNTNDIQVFCKATLINLVVLDRCTFINWSVYTYLSHSSPNRNMIKSLLQNDWSYNTNRTTNHKPTKECKASFTFFLFLGVISL